MEETKFDKYLRSSEVIDWKSPLVFQMARDLAKGFSSDEEIIKECFEFVRDGIQHSFDFKMNPVTLKASEVLKQKTGYCFAKSHLLAALLRANAIPAGLCYQRLVLDESEQPFSLHGLNAVYLKEHGWFRLDARGNNSETTSSFTPPVESLPFSAKEEGEVDFPEVWHEPLPIVVKVLQKYSDYEDVRKNLPDVEIVRFE